MKKTLNHKILVSVMFMTALVFAFSAAAYACTGVYIGSDVSEDGTAIIARSEDSHPLYNPVKLEICNAQDSSGKEICQVQNDFSWTLPEKTHTYICTPGWDACQQTDGRYSSYALNNKGLNITATVTAYVCEAALKSDPYEDDGIAEESIPDIIGASCEDARSAIELLAKICDEKGSLESNIIMVADQSEAWYMEIYTGHQYAAVKMPTDCVAAFGNEFMLESLDDFEETITSPALISLPEEKGFAVYKDDGSLDLFSTYSGKDRLSDYANLRTWYAHYLLSPSTAGQYDTLTKYPLFYEPDEKVGLSDIMQLYRSRFEGTKYDADKIDSDESRVIGTETQQTVHIIQIYPDMPQDRCTVAWTTVSQSECAPFLPVFSAMTGMDEAYTSDPGERCFDDSTAYSIFKELNMLCETDREIYKPSVLKYWQEVEEELQCEVKSVMEKSAEMSSEEASEYLTSYGKKVQHAAFEDAKVLIDDITLAMCENTDTLKSVFDYSTLTFSSKDKPDAAKISLNEEDIVGKYTTDKSTQEEGKSNGHNVIGSVFC